MSNTITPKLGLKKPDYKDLGWNVPLDENFDILDSIACGCPAMVATASDAKPVDVFVYDTTKDSDGGAWRDRCQALSWYNEPLNTVKRGATRKFPVIVGIVAEADKVTLFDLTMPDAPMWWVMNHTGDPLTCVSMLNGVLVGGGVSLFRYDFLADVTTFYSTASAPPIVNNAVNDVAMTLIGNAPVDSETGIAVPTIAVATDGGVSVIDGPAGVGTVVDGSLLLQMNAVSFTDDSSLSFAMSKNNGYNFFARSSVDQMVSDSFPYYAIYGAEGTRDLYLLDSALALESALSGVNSGNVSGLNLIDEDTTTPSNGMVNYITSLYQSGWMQGDIKGAWLADTVTGMFNPGDDVEDRSVNANPLSIVGTALTRTTVADGAELVGYSGFSVGDYLEGTDASYVDTLYCYGWQQNAGTWEFVHGVVSAAPIDGLTIVATVLKIEGTFPKTLIRVSVDTPSADQLAKIEADEKDLFTPDAKCTLQGSSDNVTSLAVDDSTGRLYAGTGSGATTFNGLLASPEEVCVRQTDGTIACTDNDEYVSISAQQEIVIHGIADNSIVNAGTINLRAALIELEAALAGKQDKLDIELNPYIDFPNLTTQPPWKEGRVFYNAVKHCLSFYNDVTDMTVDIPLEELIRVKNTSGATILNGKPVYSNGVSGGVATVALAQADLFSTSSVPGITTHDIVDGAEGFITHAGTIGGDFSAFTAGERLYLSDTVAGGFTDVAPDITTAIGIVLDNAVDGVLLVKINSNIALPTITGVLNDGAAGAYIDSNYEAIVDYLSSHQVGIPVDDLTGQITIPTVGLYKININFNVTFDELTSNNPVVVELQVWNVTTYSEEMVIPCTAVKGGNGVALSPTFTHDFTTAGQIFELRVRCQEENLNNVVYQLVSFDVESVHLRA